MELPVTVVHDVNIDFLVGLLDLAPGTVCAAVKRQRESLQNPPKTAEELLDTLESQGLTQAVGEARRG